MKAIEPLKFATGLNFGNTSSIETKRRLLQSQSDVEQKVNTFLSNNFNFSFIILAIPLVIVIIFYIRLRLYMKKHPNIKLNVNNIKENIEANDREKEDK